MMISNGSMDLFLDQVYEVWLKFLPLLVIEEYTL